MPVWPPESGGDDGSGDDAAAGDREVRVAWIGPGGAEVVETLGIDLFTVLEREDARGAAGEIVSVPVLAEGRGAASADGEVDVERIVLVGMGDASPAAHRKAGAALARALRGTSRVASTVTSASDEAGLRAFVDGLLLSTFQLDTYRSTPAKPKTLPLDTLVLAGTGEAVHTAVDTAVVMARAAWFARELVHTPPNVKDPEWLAERAREIGRAGSVDVHVRDEKKLEAEGFGGIVAVGMGSARPPRLIALRYEPEEIGPDAPHVVLVGKGVTFDTGGLSLKPRESMVTMKTDMTGAAVVMGVMSALPALGVRARVTGLVAAAENMPGASAQRPSDVIRQYDGTTVEVLNTDAEGRLMLADGIAYAVAELEPSAVVDVATLTGAATVGLGRTHAALYGTDDELADALIAAGAATGERMWRMPLVDDYRQALESTVADVAHLDTQRMSGASIAAALFLERFAAGVPWAHLDMAGPGRAEKDKDELVKGGTAFGVRALLTWLTPPPQDPE
ncbi:leucyl aminopeptidase [Actinobacteria bacterium YIM 96077]|uniref:Probable cytosol aminopeptidase n=2 Tax=Phytoactinopolyspora halophila TaxID=1981511 RepID=A0A329QS80_9ACTN|nr:leucyl aminopeptidase [Actinobacteria bacterium YIM 96077]RAW14901.1 leucyl aminopeptidase [Phytoactinopolyspora halophila]